ncbi:MAG: LCP family protein [Clostridia bacterium]|nr:LCP family protein [Clostridia bacterium]
MKRLTVKKVILILVVAFFAFLSINLGVQYAKLNHMTTLDTGVTEVLDEPPLRGKMNMLLLGVDEGGHRSDTMMVVSVDNVKNEIKLLSIPRDTKITLSNGQVVKANALIGFERREELVIETIKAMTGMPIHYYCEVDFDGFIEIIDVLGGVDYNVPHDMNYDDPVQDLHIHLKAGPQHLDGQAAHDFVRFRHNNKSEDVYAPGEYYKGDIGRIGAQQDFLAELFRQKMQPQYILKASELLDTASKYVRTNFTISSALDFISMLKSTNSTDLESFILPGTDRYENNISYYIYSPSETKKLVLEEFGYPEDEAKKLEESKKTASASPSAESEATSDATDGEDEETVSSADASAKASSTPSAKASSSAKASADSDTSKEPENTRVPVSSID